MRYNTSSNSFGTTSMHVCLKSIILQTIVVYKSQQKPQPNKIANQHNMYYNHCEKPI